MGRGGGVVGIVANPMAGKDIRRLVSAASPVSDMAKIGIIRRAMIGAAEGGASRVVVAEDRSALARRAAEGLDLAALGLSIEPLDLAILSASRDSQRAAAAMAEIGVKAIVVLGGDGTHRDVAKGWRHAPIVTLSTGTNNVFPRPVEATLAGLAAGRVASAAVALTDCAHQAKVIDVAIARVVDRGIEGSADDLGSWLQGSAGRVSGGAEPERGEPQRADLALVDVALTDGAFTASRAVWRVESLRQLVVAIAEPASVGLSAIAAAVLPLRRRDPGGVTLTLGPSPGAAEDSDQTVRAPIAPGRFETVAVRSARRVATAEPVRWAGPGVLSFDGERDVVLGADETATLRLASDGPWVIDVAAALSRSD